MIYISEDEMDRIIAMDRVISGPFDPGAYRPWVGSDGRTYLTVHTKQGLKSAAIDAYGTLRRDEWKALDEKVLEVARYQLVGIQDLIDNNLVVNIPGLGTTEFESHTMSEAMEAGVSMDPALRSRKDRPEFGQVFTPMPIVHSDFSIGKRPLEASRKGGGNDLQTDSVAQATRVVTERLEQMLFADESFKFGRGFVYSYVNHPDRTQVVLAESWATASPDDVLEDVQGMIQASIDSRHYGPFNMYLPSNYVTVPDKDYSLMDGGLTVKQRLLQLEGLQSIKTAPFLADGNVLLVSMQPDTIRLLYGLAPTAVQWTLNGGFTNEFKVLACMIPQIRSDHYGRSGVVHASV